MLNVKYNFMTGHLRLKWFSFEQSFIFPMIFSFFDGPVKAGPAVVPDLETVSKRHSEASLSSVNLLCLKKSSHHIDGSSFKSKEG